MSSLIRPAKHQSMDVPFFGTICLFTFSNLRDGEFGNYVCVTCDIRAWECRFIGYHMNVARLVY